MKGFIRLPNDFFKQQLSPKAMFVFCFLEATANRLRTKTITYAELAKQLRIDSKTATAAIAELIEKGLVVKTNRYGSLGYKANKYFLKPLNLKSGFFTVCREAFDTNISAIQFMVYVAIQRCRSTKTETAFPSKSALSKLTGLSERSCDNAVEYLQRFSFISKKQRKYKTTNAFRSNEYKNRVFEENSVKKEAPLAYAKDTATSTVFNIHQSSSFVKRFFAVLQKVRALIERRVRGSAYFPKHLLNAQENI